jgi:long-subunit fatty acid transport protein
MIRRFLSFLAPVLLAAASVSATSIFSYHPEGLGYPEWRGDGRIMGMGGVSLAMTDQFGVAGANPAAISGMERTALSASFLSQKRSVSDDQGLSGTFYDQYPRLFRAVVPIGRGVVSSIGLESIGDVRMIWANRASQNSVSFLDSLEASGGAWAVSAQVARRFGDASIGIRAQIIRGNMTTEWRRTVLDSLAPLASSALATRRFSGVAFGVGGAYEISDRWTVGGVFELPTELDGTNTSSLGSRIPNAYYKSHSDKVMAVNTDVDDTVSTETKTPMGISFGVAWKPGERALLSADADYHRWSAVSPSFRNTWRFAVGSEFHIRTDYRSFLLLRIPYRVGIRYEQHYIPALSARAGASSYPDANYYTAGLGIPLGRGRGQIDYSVEYGVRGSIGDNLVRERVWRHTISVVGWERWFVRNPRR